MKPSLTQEQVKNLFDYRNGALYWKARPREDFKSELAFLQWNPKHTNKKAGCYSSPYVTVTINKNAYLLHRLIFLWHYGYLPEIVDHADCNPKNNNIENLREATKADNQRNSGMYVHNTTGYKGVVWNKTSKKWFGKIKVMGKIKYLGTFETKELAAEFVALAREMLHGKFANHGYKGA